MKNKKNAKTNAKTKENAKLLFKSLISNDTAIIGARKKGWWWAVLMLFFSAAVAIIPSTVSSGSRDGSDFLNVTNVSGYDVSFRRMVENFKEKGIELTVRVDAEDKKNNYLEATGIKSSQGLEPIYRHYNKDGRLDFEAYYHNDVIDELTLSTCVNNIPVFASDGSTTYTSRASSMVIFGKYQVVSYLYMTGSTTPSGSIVGNYQSFKSDYKLTSIIDNGFEKDNVDQYNDYVNATWNNVKAFYSTAYKTTVFTTTWQTALIIFGINVAITLFMGLMVFVLTRGKQNPFRIYTLWEAQKIAYWATIAPGLLSIALGFLMSSFAQVSFPMLLGIRVMWMSMKSLRPETANEALLEDVKKDRVVNAK